MKVLKVKEKPPVVVPVKAPSPTATVVPTPPAKAVLNPPTPKVWRSTCGVCHCVHVLDEKMGNRNNVCVVLGRKVDAFGLPLIELLCLRCGNASWKVDKTYPGTVAKMYANLLMKKG